MLQPKNKTFGYYILKGMIYNNFKCSNTHFKLLNKISLIDESILIIDDILDKSEFRNSKLCLYKTSLEKAIIISEQYRFESINSLFKLMSICKTSNENRLKILDEYNNFLNNIYKGQSIDLSLIGNNLNFNVLFKKYMNMICLFTGEHIKSAIKIGFLLTNNSCDLKIEQICFSLGKIRQMCDDFDDYFKIHHSPFGDFKSNNNRLPELLFTKNKGNRNKILELIKLNKSIDVINSVLTFEIRSEIFNLCKKEYENILRLSKNVNFDYKDILIDFNYILTKKK